MIKFQDVQIKYDDFIAIDNLNLEVKKGEFFTLLGPSGCGKTTTLRSLVGFAPVSKGAIYVDDKEITHLPIENRGIGIVFQSYALFPSMSVYENIAFGLKVRKKSKDAIDKKVKEMANVVDLDEKQLNKNVSELSGGQQQRVAIARALALEPEILVLDEPLSNLDAKLRKQLRKELKKLQFENGLTAIYVTHDQEEALTLSDRIAVFNKGRIEQVGTPREIYEKSSTEFVCNFIGDANYIPTVLIEEINKEVGGKFNINNHHYIRLEKIMMNNLSPARIQLKGKIVNEEYYGLYTLFTISIQGTLLKVIGDYDDIIQSDDDVTVSINPLDILEYGGN
ncbi:ABC transporter ATP-binding protein [Macrococcus capreoli]|uniref:ABC transporter ATP-binding protein n=1 Tax=Macrococcus capreoli TaxID=2982690 RepID=UPI0021D58A2B|nr:ABC transporter ATP-binding protein [Macrococcus sp. TMW 2.2395]MCU7557416.1 ABC transporter ATP-binding protein [Macrococcus sp. TMW 2.2395]